MSEVSTPYVSYGNRLPGAPASSWLFPMPLPFPQAWRELRGSESWSADVSAKQRRKRSAQQLVNLQVGLFNYYWLESPKNCAAGRVQTNQLTVEQRKVAEHLLSHAHRFVSSSGGEIPRIGRGRSRIYQQLQTLSCRYGQDGVDWKLLGANTTAIPVDPKLVAIPESAGVVCPSRFLCPERRKVFLDLQKIVKPPEELPRTPPRPCHMISFEDEVSLVKDMLKANMGQLLPEDEIARHPDGSILRAGWFGVPHRKGKLRLICDRRPQNSCERTLPWCNLPHGTDFIKMLLRPHETLRASGDDCSNFFFQWRHQPEWLPRQAVGRRLPGKLFGEFAGISTGTNYRFCLSVVAMGDTNGVSICQAAHTGLLEEAGCMKEKERMEHRRPPPISDLWEGVYIDDHCVVLRLDRERLRCRPGCECRACARDGGRLKDICRIDSSREKYKEIGLPLSQDKQFNLEQSFEIWGTSVNGHTGRVGVSEEKLRQLFRLLVASVGNSCTKNSFQGLLGSIVFPFMHNRSCMSALSQSFVWCDGLQEGQLHRMPGGVVDEILSCALLLPLCFTNIRSNLSRTVSSTDSSGARGGSCVASVPDKIARVLFRKSEFHGEHGRLSWSELTCDALPSEMTKPDEDLNQLVSSLPWCRPICYLHPHSHHINIQELNAVLDELSRRTQMEHERSSRYVNVIDSRVALGALGKGRSSSVALNSVLRRISVLSLACDVGVRGVWVASASNPSDDPSRAVALRRASPPPPWAEHLFAATQSNSIGSSYGTSAEDFECTVCGSDELGDRPPHRAVSSVRKAREYYGGKAGLTDALKNKGIACESYEAYDDLGFHAEYDMSSWMVIDREIEDAKNHRFQYGHFGISCSSWSTISKMNGGSRTKIRARGDGRREKELTGNLQHDEMHRLIQAMRDEGLSFSIENPLHSYLWSTEESKALMACEDVFVVDLCQCMYGLRPPDARLFDGDVRVCKPTRLVTNVKALTQLARQCDGKHSHVHTLGTCRDKTGKLVRRSAAAAAYPPALCRQWAKLLAVPP